MAATGLDLNKIIEIFRTIVKRKTTYNETNLHYEYFKQTGDTIPYKEDGFDSLRDFIKKNAGDFFYFERVGKDLEFIAPKKMNDSLAYSEVEKEANNVLMVKKVEDGNYSGSETSKCVRVSSNIYFGRPQSTGLNNPFQNIRNDINISFDFNAQKREVGEKNETNNDELMTDSESSTNKMQQTNEDELQSNTYSSARNKSEQMDVDEERADDLPWHNKYWHLRITHPVSTNEIWARFFDGFEASKFLFCKICFQSFI